MYNIVKIGDKEVPMMSMASVDIYYRNVFHRDALKTQVGAMDEADSVNFVLEMAFIMAKFAELNDRKEMLKLNEESFIEWLDQFDRVDLINALPDAQKTYEGQMLETADAKKNTDALSVN